MSMATSSVDFVLAGDPATARASADSALTQQKFQVTWTNDQTGTAERGSKVVTALVGGKKSYMKVGMALRNTDPGQTTLHIEPATSGWSGGPLAANRVSKDFASLRADLEQQFRAAGVLRDVRAF
jgi:hypothetical protein